MGFLERSGSPEIPGPTSFSKAVFSIWFRIPASEMTAARAQFFAATDVFPDSDFKLAGVIPLITFGPNNQTYTLYGTPDPLSTGPISPCVIGVSCGSFADDVQNKMYVRLQYASGAPSVAPATNVYNDFFQVGERLPPSQIGGAYEDGSFIIVTPDAWHHALVSFDVSAGVSVAATAPFYWAFDDVNYNGAYLWPNTPEAVGEAPVPNGIFSDGCIRDDLGGSFAAGNIPTAAHPVGVPSSSGNASKIYNVQMARVQVFTGVTMDTSVTANRRAFITSTGTPADPALARALLGRSPIIEFRTQSDWINGINRGTLGNFSKTGTITAYSQDPDI